MAYADQKMSGGRIAAIVIVALIHAIIGYAFVTGLAYQYVKKAAEKLNTFDVNEPPPPPPEPPPPPPEQQQQPPPVVTPPPIVSVLAPSPPTIVTVPTPPPVYVPAPPAPPAPPPPPAAPVVNKQAGPKGNPQNWISQDDYPASALRAEAQGTTAISWDIGTDGKIENCRVTASSGNADLDDAACRALTRHGRYSPALDQAGSPIRVTGQTRRVVWRLPAD